jgi:hypothetical protein
MIRTFALSILLAAALPMVAAAQDCEEHIDSTRKSLATAIERMSDVPQSKRARVQGFLDDAARILAQAKDACDSAQSPLDRSFAIGKVLVAQGNISAAHLLIRADEE